MDSRKKKIIAFVLAAAVVITAIPATSFFATGTEGTQTEDTQNKDTQPPKPTDTENAGTAATEEPVTMADYKVIAESDTYRMYFYEPRLSVIFHSTIY